MAMRIADNRPANAPSMPVPVSPLNVQRSWAAKLPKLVPIVILQPSRGRKDASGRLYSQSYAEHLVQEARAKAGLDKHVTLAACRHGGMTLLGDAGITEQGVMALSGHRTPQAARIYVKRTEQQHLAAARQRRSYLESEGLAERKECVSGNGASSASGNGPTRSYLTR